MRNRSLIAALAMSSLAAAAEPPVPYPEGYRQWTHVKSMVIEPGHPLHASFGGIHHLYANAPAEQGYRKGGRFPEGSVIVFDLREAKSADHAVTEGAPKIVGVMHKDSKAYAATGGWGYEGFAPGQPQQRAVGNNAKTACYGCHTAQREADFVFSRWRE